MESCGEKDSQLGDVNLAPKLRVSLLVPLVPITARPAARM